MGNCSTLIHWNLTELYHWSMILFWYTAKCPECISNQLFTVLLTNDINLVYWNIPRIHQWSLVYCVIDQWYYFGILQNSQNAPVINSLLYYWPMVYIVLQKTQNAPVINCLYYWPMVYIVLQKTQNAPVINC